MNTGSFSGIEYLMNTKQVSNQKSSNVMVDVNDVDNLDHELDMMNDEMGGDGGGGGGFSASFQSDLFGGGSGGGGRDDDATSIHFDEVASVHDFEIQHDDDGLPIDMSTMHGASDNIGAFASHNTTNHGANTWDGYGQVNPDAGAAFYGSSNGGAAKVLSKSDEMRAKMKLLRQLAKYESKHGFELSKKYTMDSNLEEMMAEYDVIKEEYSRQRSIRMQGELLLFCINGLERANKYYDPFGIDFDGVSNALEDDMEEYDDIFGELHDKWKDTIKTGPELRLAYKLGATASLVAFTNSAAKQSSIPGADEILRNNPELARQFQMAAMNMMAPTNPGFAGFMQNMMNVTGGGSGGGGNGIPTTVNTQGENAVPPPMGRAGNNSFDNRLPFGGANVQTRGGPIAPPPPNASPMNAMNMALNAGPGAPTGGGVGNTRPEMRGPSDLSHILGNLKTRTASIHVPVSSPLPPPPQVAPFQNMNNNISNMQAQMQAHQQQLNESSVISTDEMSQVHNAKMPKRTRRKKPTSASANSGGNGGNGSGNGASISLDL